MPDSRRPLDPAEAVAEVLELVRGTSISDLEVEWEGGLVRVKRDPHREPIGSVAVTPSEPVEPEDVIVTSTYVGVFRRDPDRTFPSVGDQVSEGTVLAEIESIQFRNPVVSPVDGELVSLEIEDLSPVEYGQPLATIRPEGAV